LFSGFDKRNGVRQDRRLRVLAVRMVVAQRRIDSNAIAEKILGGGDDSFDRHGHFPLQDSTQDATAADMLASVWTAARTLHCTIRHQRRLR
jgi:hypothetical protein